MRDRSLEGYWKEMVRQEAPSKAGIRIKGAGKTREREG